MTAIMIRDLPMEKPVFRGASVPHAIQMLAKYGKEIKVEDSSCVRGLQYDFLTHMLTVRFVRGTRYAYDHVDPGVMDKVLHAPSHGRAFLELVRGKYPAYRLEV